VIARHRNVLRAALIFLGAELLLFSATAVSAVPLGLAAGTGAFAGNARYRHLSQFVIQGPIGFGIHSSHRSFRWDGEPSGGSRRRGTRHYQPPKSTAGRQQAGTPPAPQGGGNANSAPMAEPRAQGSKGSAGDDAGSRIGNTGLDAAPAGQQGTQFNTSPSGNSLDRQQGSQSATRSTRQDANTGANATGQAGQAPGTPPAPPQNQDRGAQLAQTVPAGQQSFANTQQGGKACDDCEDSCFAEWHTNCVNADLCNSGYASCLRICKRQSCK
jgi:hypothetical protein